MTGFEPRTSDVGSNRSSNGATTTAQRVKSFLLAVVVLQFGRAVASDIWNYIKLYWNDENKKKLKFGMARYEKRVLAHTS